MEKGLPFPRATKEIGDVCTQAKLISDNSKSGLAPKILTLKINQGTKFGTLKMPMFILFDVVILFFN